MLSKTLDPPDVIVPSKLLFKSFNKNGTPKNNPLSLEFFACSLAKS